MDEITDKIAFHYDELVREDNDPFRDPPEMKEYMEEWDGREFFTLLALTGKEKVLEIGCGTGRMAGAVLGSCREYTGLDLSPVSIVRARENLSSVPGTPTALCPENMTVSFPRSLSCISVKKQPPWKNLPLCFCRKEGSFFPWIKQEKKILNIRAERCRFFPIRL